MSIASEIARISKNVEDSLDAVATKGVTIPSGSTSDDLASLILQIQTGSGSVDLFYVTPEQYGAVGDGVTDDSQAVQDACDAGYAVFFASSKTYYLASTVTIDHDCHLFGGEGATIMTKTPTGGTAPNGIIVTGALKKATTMITDYTSNGDTANCGNKFTLSDMTGIAIGDVMVIEATDQYYNYARSYYYLGATLLVTDIYDGHIYTNINMPFDIVNTANVSVKVYSAPTAIVDNLTFVSDLNSVPSYEFLLSMRYCKCSDVNNCEFTQMANGLALYNCVNTKVSDVIMSKSKWDNSISGDGYGLRIDASTNTVVERMIATCAQHAITISGNLPAIDTYIRYCNLTAECRSPGLDTHESVYNLVVEDSTLGTLCLNSVATVNRCRIIGNRRVGNNSQPLPIYGSHIADRSKIRFSETVFEPGIYINALPSGAQDPIQPFDNVFGAIEIVNCTGGHFAFSPSTSSTILSNTIDHLLIDNWTNVLKIYHGSGNGVIKSLEIKNTTFGNRYFITDNNESHGIILDGIEQIVWNNAAPILSKSTINRTTMGECCIMPGGVPINVTSNNVSAKFRICGANVTPNVIDDYLVGLVTGNDGAAMARSVYTGSNVSLSMNGDGDLVYTQGANTSTYCIYPVGMYKCFYKSDVSISAILQNAGQTTGAKFTPYVAVIDGATGLIRRRNSGISVEATAQGAELTHTDVYAQAGDYVLPYIRCSTAYANAVTVIKDLKFTIISSFAPSVVNEDYMSVRRTGDGTLLSLPGVNNICCSEDTFTVKFEADMAYNPIWQLPSASGVNF